MVWPWIMPYAIIYLAVRVAGAFGAELPYGPILAMFVVKESYESVGGNTVGALRIC